VSATAPHRLTGRPAAARLLAASIVLAAGLPAVPAAGRQLAVDPAAPVVARPAGLGPSCSGPGWFVHDDGGVENGVGWDPMTVSDGIYLDRFDLGPSPTTDVVTKACVRIGRLGGDSTVDFAINFWSLNGPGGDPDMLLGSVPATATGVPVGLPGQFYEVDVSGLGLPAQGVVGAGMRWNPMVDQGFFLMTDESPTTAFTDPVGSGDGGANWDNVVNGAPNVRTTTVRVQEGPDPLIFADGFESGDTSSWSATVP